MLLLFTPYTSGAMVDCLFDGAIFDGAIFDTCIDTSTSGRQQWRRFPVPEEGEDQNAIAIVLLLS